MSGDTRDGDARRLTAQAGTTQTGTTDNAQTNAALDNAALIDASRTDDAQTDAVRHVTAQAGTAQTEAALDNAALIDANRTDGAQTDAARHVAAEDGAIQDSASPDIAAPTGARTPGGQGMAGAVPVADGRGPAGTVHVVGGGLAGLAAAVALTEAGRQVVLYEAGPACGGRARSYEDRQLGCRIDNGNHLLLSANQTVFRYLDTIGARDSLVGPGEPMFPFHDLAADLRWCLRLSHGRIPWWVLRRRSRVPGMRLRELGGLLRLMRARPEQSVSDCLDPGQLADRLMIPLAVSVLNTRPETGSAALMGRVMRESMAKGGAACVPWFPRDGLSESLVDPAVALLRRRGAEIRTGCRVAGLELAGGRVGAMLLPDGRRVLGPGDQVVLALPAQSVRDVAAGVLPDLVVPDQFEGILNLHFRADVSERITGDLARSRFAGVVGGVTEWVFVKQGILSVTVSAANHLAERSQAELAQTIWAEVRAVVLPFLPEAERAFLPLALPPHRVVREKRATFAATPAQERLRPESRTRLGNLVLAGDWTATGLPATIEGAMRSGLAAAGLLCAERTGSTAFHP